MSALPQSDPYARAHADAKAAVATFLPSVMPKPQAPPGIAPGPSQAPISESVRAALMAKKAEKMSARVARGMPPEPPAPPPPEQQFGNVLDVVHIRALQNAIAAHPEVDRSKLISEAHDQVTKWIASHNGKVVVNGHVEVATSAQGAEKLAQKIVNGALDEHDQRKAAVQTLQANAPDDSVSGTSLSSAPSQSDAAPAPSAQGSPTPVSPVEPVLSPASSPDSTMQPQVVPPASGTIEDTGPAPAVSPEEAAAVGTENEDGSQITQPKDDVDENRALAMQAAPELHQHLTNLSAQVPGTRYDRIRPQKDADRLGEKVDDDKDPETLSDYLGAQVSADSPQAKDQLLSLLKNTFKTIEVDDHFLTGRQDKAGYPSTNVQVQLSNGSTGEVQIVPKEVQDRTGESHPFYKAGREAELAGDNDERDKQWGKAKEIHDQALDQFKARNGISGDPAGKTGSPSLAGYEPVGDPIQIGGHTFLRVRSASGQQTQGTPQTSQDTQESLAAASPDATAVDQTLESAPDNNETQALVDQPKSEVPTPVSQSDSSSPDYTSDMVESANDSDVPVPLESDGAQGRGVQGAGAGNDEQLQRGVSGRVQSGDQPERLSKGQAVTLKDGRTGEVAYVHPRLNKMRVRVGGKNVDVDPTKDLA